MFRICLGHVLHTLGTFVRLVWEMFGMGLGNVWDHKKHAKRQNPMSEAITSGPERAATLDTQTSRYRGEATPLTNDTFLLGL